MKSNSRFYAPLHRKVLQQQPPPPPRPVPARDMPPVEVVCHVCGLPNAACRCG